MHFPFRERFQPRLLPLCWFHWTSFIAFVPPCPVFPGFPVSFPLFPCDFWLLVCLPHCCLLFLFVSQYFSLFICLLVLLCDFIDCQFLVRSVFITTCSLHRAILCCRCFK